MARPVSITTDALLTQVGRLFMECAERSQHEDKLEAELAKATAEIQALIDRLNTPIVTKPSRRKA